MTKLTCQTAHKIMTKLTCENNESFESL